VLERERTARETTQKSLAEQDADVSRLDGELIALSITNADQELSLKEQGATVISLSKRSRMSAVLLRWRRSRLKVGRHFVFCFADLSFEGSFPF
jgi:septal ring factor EnvC (AmiA/AmiB activator)